MLALIDADVLVYQVGFAMQKTRYIYKGVSFDSKDRLHFYLSDIKKELDPDCLEEVIDVEPIQNACSVMKNKIKKICRKVGASKYRCYLTKDGSDNFRKQIAKTLEYKGNRKQPKPVLYHDLRGYLTEYHKAIVTNKCEADDALAITQVASKENTTIICSIDKDLLQVPGWHYNWDTQQKTYISGDGHLELEENDGKKKLRGCGWQWFLAQMIMGDRTDNIKGIPKMGDVGAYKFLSRLEDEDSHSQLVGVMSLYQTTYGDDWKERFEENARLLWMCREEREISPDFNWMSRYATTTLDNAF